MFKSSAPKLAQYFRDNDNWKGKNPNELRRALEWAIWAQAYSNLSAKKWKLVLPEFENEINYAMYMMCRACFPFVDSPDLSIVEANARFAEMTFDSKISKHNCFAGYMNGYMYGYVHNTEMKKLHTLIDNSPDVPMEFIVDFFLTTIVFQDTVESNPGKTFEYHGISGVPATRVQALEKTRNQIISAYQSGDEAESLKLVYYAMTYFAGSRYRSLHKGLMVEIFGFNDLADVRTMFNDNAENLLQNKGALKLRGIVAD